MLMRWSTTSIQSSKAVMQLSVKGKQLDVGDALRTHVTESLSRILDKYFGDAIDCAVTLSRDAHLYRAVVSAHVGRGIKLEAQGEASEPYPAFDAAAERLSTRLRRHKRRLRDHSNKLAGAEDAPLPAQQYILAGEGDEELSEESGGDNQPVVVAEMTTEIPTLTVSEAVMHMDLGDMPAMMFRNSAHGGLNMVYRRSDGNIGWVDPRGNRNA
ncbi:ribosome-associated translation inhibitor RaiA [Pelagibius sp.]|uniref:ribosome hibernation-promoting factor, HPF/YfiA family n=1 Tax=Pelagibius sp. TaxID=1931238 RepID=UPI00262433EE|nr:ribosome-associated translation inhibitor RaiA [Pelagibius sp.]